MTQELTAANDLAKEARSLHVETPKQAVYATEFLSRANQVLDLLETKEAERTQRLKEELAFIKAPYIEPKKALKAIIVDLRTKLGTYQTEQMQQAAKEAIAIAERTAAGRLRPETAVRKMDEIDVPEDKIETEAGSLTFRPKQVLKIVDIMLIPHEYLVPEEEVILAALKAGKAVPGCELETIQVPYNRRS